MKVLISPHASALLSDLITDLSIKLSYSDGIRWEGDIQEAIMALADFPESGRNIPESCFETVPDNLHQLRQTFCLPYRIVYEVVENEIHVLSVRHTRMLVTETDTSWD